MSYQSLVSQIFEPNQAKLLVDLYKNESKEGKEIIYETIAKQLASSDKVVIGNELNQILLIMSESHFLLSNEEPLQVSAMMFYCLKQEDVLPKVTENSGKNLGAKCLVSLSLFEPALQSLCNRHGAPNPSFYRNVGKAVLGSENMREVSLNFDKWVHYIREHFV